MKTCKACGEEKPLTEFYTANRGTSTMPFCKECWAIDQRYKYLKRRAAEVDQQTDTNAQALSDQQHEELERIEQLYEARRAAGLTNPGETYGQRASVAASIDKQLEKFSS